MRKNRQATRSLVAFLVTWSFLVLTVTGIVLYIVPQGRIAYWIHWSFAGLDKEQWGWVHMMFGGVFIVTGILHLYFNWKPFQKYLADRVKGHFEPKREVFLATAFTVLVFAVSAAKLPPASWIIDLNARIKATWVTSPELEPPFGHAEELSLAGLSRRMNLDLAKVSGELEQRGIRFEGAQASLEQIARANGTTPMALYAMIRQHEKPISRPERPLSPEAIEAQYAGSGLGRKTLDEIARTVGVDQEEALQRLARLSILASGADNTKAVAEQHGLSPMDLIKIMTLPGDPTTD